MTARPLLLTLLLPLAACGLGATAPASTISTAPSVSTVSTADPYGSTIPGVSTVSSAPSTVSSPAPMNETTATITTSMGDIVVTFYPDKAPKHVANFLALAKRGVYDGTLFHRVIPGFMVQGGDPSTKDPATPRSRMGTGSATDESGKEIRLPAEFSDISHTRGILSAARSSDPNSASAQFFIVVADSTFLDGQYTVFGKVTSGMEVADKIVATPRDTNDNPNEAVKIVKVTISG